MGCPEPLLRRKLAYSTSAAPAGVVRATEPMIEKLVQALVEPHFKGEEATWR